MSRIVDLRSDTFTLPSDAMYAALREAPLGDDVYGEDPTVSRLERLAAELTGKDAALLVASGTQGNLTALMAQCERGSEVILGADSDLFNAETGGLSVLAGLMPRPVDDRVGFPAPEAVRAAIRPPDVHFGPTGALCLESTHQRSGGLPIPLDVLGELAAVAREHAVPVHLDAARLFNAAVGLGVDAREVTRHVDTLTFCLSKGLSCPIGSVVCGSSPVIEKARWVRKMLGGGMRQAGWIAAAGLVGLQEGVARLEDDHALARLLADLLEQIAGVVLKPAPVRTNIVYLSVPGWDDRALVGRLAAAGVRAFPMGAGEVRFVVHRGVDEQDVRRTAEITAAVVRGEPAGGDDSAVAAAYRR
jgi:threonine aldolase